MKRYIESIMRDERQGLAAAFIKGILKFGSLLYAVGVWAVRGMHEMGILPVFTSQTPVISIGNITVGGSGKTPLVIWLVKQLKAARLEVVVLTRGYMAEPGKDSDEVRMINEQVPGVPVLIGKDRISNIKAYQNPVDVFVCDDAFQHWKLGRDLDVVAIDSSNPFGSGHLLPRGILRESLSALKRADVFVLTKVNFAGELASLTQRLKRINPNALTVEVEYVPCDLVDLKTSAREPVTLLKGKKIVCVSAIADPTTFVLGLKKIGAELGHQFQFSDHHQYTPLDVEAVVEYCKDQAIHLCITTHKDAVKLAAYKDLFAHVEFKYLSVELELVKGKDEFLSKVMACCRA